MTVDVDYWRQLDVFKPDSFKKPVHVIGAGATGSYVTWLLAKMGVKDLTVWDFDFIEAHNLPNQMYFRSDMDPDPDVKTQKVDALAKMIREATGITIKTHNTAFTDGKLKGLVFLLTDTMTSRKAIWEASISGKLGVELLVETRMAINGGIIYAIKPAMPKEAAAYAKTLHSDSDSEESPCSAQAISPTVAAIAGLAAHAVVDFANKKPLAHETMLSMSPPSIFTRQFDGGKRK